MQLEGSTFIVTGGASGLGAATARMFVDGGGRVVAVYAIEPEWLEGPSHRARETYRAHGRELLRSLELSDPARSALDG